MSRKREECRRYGEYADNREGFEVEQHRREGVWTPDKGEHEFHDDEIENVGEQPEKPIERNTIFNTTYRYQ